MFSYEIIYNEIKFDKNQILWHNMQYKVFKIFTMDHNSMNDNNYHQVIKQFLDQGQSKEQIKTYIMSRGFSEAEFSEMYSKAQNSSSQSNHSYSGGSNQGQAAPPAPVAPPPPAQPNDPSISQDSVVASKLHEEIPYNENSKFSKSWALFKMCFSIVKSHKSIMLFPIISSITLVIVMAGFVGGGTIIIDPDSEEVSIMEMLYLLSAYIVSAFIMVYFNVGLASAVKRHFEGKEISISLCLRDTNKHIHVIFAYAAIAGTVGFILKILEQKFEGLANILVRIMGAGWALATFFIAPVLASEDIGPVDAIKKSINTFKKTWGETLILDIGMGLINFFIALGFTLFGVGLIFLAVMLESMTLIILTIVLLLIFLFILGLLFTTLGAVYRTALYYYATNDGKAPPQFNQHLLQNAIRIKR